MTEKPPAVLGWLKRLSKSGNTFTASIAFNGEDADFLQEWFGGYPKEGETRCFAIARVDERMAAAFIHNREMKTLAKPRSPASEAGHLCSTPAFWRYLREETIAGAVNSEQEAAEFIRKYCNVHSRSDIAHKPEALELWKEIRGGYYRWLNDPE